MSSDEAYIWGLIVMAVLVVVAFIGFAAYTTAAARRSLAAAKKELEESMAAYRASLMALRDDPTNSTLRQRTLELGRAYAHLTRNREGVAIFDEVALMNDITAAVGAASLISGMRNLPPSPLQAASIEERLSRLATLRDQGLITAEEYASRRAAMLSEL